MGKPKILCPVALPPPHHGVSVANDLLLNSKIIRNNFEIKIVPLSKPKLQLGGNLSPTTLGVDLSVTNKLLKELIIFKPCLTYITLAQTRLGLWRDGIWIWLAALSGSRVLAHLHGGYFRKLFDKDLDRLGRGFARATLNHLQGIIVLDPSFIHIFQGLVPEERIFVLRNGIPEFCSDTPWQSVQQQRAGQSDLRVTFLSNLVPGKGFDTFLEAAAFLRGENFLFNLAGAAPKPEIAAQVAAFVAAHRLENRVHMLGKILGTEKHRLLLQSDVFVFPSSLSEGQPIVIIEALAAGLPVISTARGCIPAIVRDGINGFIVPENNPEAIAERLIWLKNNPSLRLAMGQTSRNLYLNHHTEEKFVTAFTHIVDQVLARN